MSDLTYTTPSKENPYTQPEVIKAQGSISIRKTTVIALAAITLILLFGGLYAHITDPSHAKDLWLIIGPLIGGSISGLVGIALGQKSES